MRVVAWCAWVAVLASSGRAAADTPYVGVSAGYEVLAIGPKNWADGLVGTLRVAPRDERFNVTALLDYRVGIFVDSIPNGLRIDTAAFRVMIGMRIARHGPLVLEGALGGGVDVIRTETRPAVGPVGSLVLPALRAAVSERFRVWEHLEVVVSAVLEVDPTGTSFVTSFEGQSITVLTPWPVRPGLMLELAAP